MTRYRVDYYLRGRQLGRYRNDYPSRLCTLTQTDWYHINALCRRTNPNPNEERYPANWVSNSQSVYGALKQWRKFMRVNGPEASDSDEHQEEEEEEEEEEGDIHLNSNRHDSNDWDSDEEVIDYGDSDSGDE